jgi:MinD-like ATPase involved in chromosome partitioning or flagellar assembly
VSDNWGTNNHEFDPATQESASEHPTGSHAQPDETPPRGWPQAAGQQVADSSPSGQWPAPPPDPDAYDDATRPVSPDIVASVLNPPPAAPAQPPPPPQWPQPREGDAQHRAPATPPPPPAAPEPPHRYAGSAQQPEYRPGGYRQGDYPQPEYGQAEYRQSPRPAPGPRSPDGGRKAGRRDPGQFPDPNPRAAQGVAGQGPSSLVERLSPEVLAPPPKPQPTRGWRRAVLKMTGGLINPGLSTAEETHVNQVNTIVARLSGDCYRIGVMVGKGGTGKTTVATIAASIFAEYRSDDRVVAVDADPAFGKIANRIAPSLSQTYWELLSDEDNGRLRRWTDVKASLGSNPHTGLWLLRGEHRSKGRRVINREVYKRAMGILDRYMTIAVIDCGPVLEHPLMEAVLPTLDAVIVVGALEQGAGEAAAQTLAWLEDHGYHRLLKNGVVVLNDPRGRADKRTRKVMLRDFITHVDAATVLLPYDRHLSEGGVIDTKKGLSAQARKAGIEITAHLARGFAATTLEGQRR